MKRQWKGLENSVYHQIVIKQGWNSMIQLCPDTVSYVLFSV